MDPEPANPNELAAGVSNLDTARLALRWALERIRGLEAAGKEAVELREKARIAKECAELELSAARASIAKGMSEMLVKERFLSEMRQILTSHFRGEVEVKESLDVRQLLEEELTRIREAADRQVDAAEAAARRSAEQADTRLAALKRGHAAVLAELERQHREDGDARQELEARLARKDGQLRALEERRAREYEVLRAENKQLEEGYTAEEQRRADEAAQRLRFLQGRQEGELQSLRDELRALEERRARECQALRDEMRSLEEGYAAQQQRRADEAAERLRVLVERQEGELQSLRDEFRALEERRAREGEALRAESSRLEQDRAAQAQRRADEAAQMLGALKQRQEGELRSLSDVVEGLQEAALREGELHARQLESLRAVHRKAEERLRRELEALNAEARQAELPAAAPDTKAAAPSPRRRPIAALAGIAAIVLTAATLALTSGKEHVIPTAHPTALVWKNDLLWVSDWHAQAIYALREQSSGLKVARRHELPGSHIVGLALSGDRMFLADSWARKLSRRRLDAGLTLEASVPSPGPKPSALFFDGKYLWSADQELRRIYQHADDASLSVLSSYPVPHAPVALHADAAGFWTVDAESVNFLRHQPPPNLSIEGVYRLRELADDSHPFSAFTRRGGRLWVAKDGSNKLLERAAWRLAERPRANNP